jgi:hypothetical protein
MPSVSSGIRGLCALGFTIGETTKTRLRRAVKIGATADHCSREQEGPQVSSFLGTWRPYLALCHSAVLVNFWGSSECITAACSRPCTPGALL